MLGYVAHWRCVMYLTDNLLSGYFRDVACPAVTSTRGGAPGSPVSLPFYLLNFLPFLFVELHVHVWLIVERKKLSF